MLYDKHDIKPIIDTRKLWKNKTQETLFRGRYDVFTYNETGQSYMDATVQDVTNVKALRLAVLENLVV